MTRGKAGQTSSVSLAGAADSGGMVIQKQYFASGDTRAPVTASPFPFCVNFERHRSHISSRTSSGGVSTDITWPTSNRLSQQSLRAKDVRRSVNSSLVQRGVCSSAIGDPSEWGPIGIGNPAGQRE